MHRRKLLFFGTPLIAVPLLERLASDTRFSIVGVITQPDRPVGRKHVLTASAVKETAQKLGIPVFQPETLKTPEALALLAQFSFDAAVVFSYGNILPQTLLDLAPNRFVNVHGSILPNYRGASPITEAIKNGDVETGISTIVMDAQMDHGAVLSEARLAITNNDTTETLGERMGTLAAEHLPDVLHAYLEGTLAPREQDHARATFCHLLKKEDGMIDPQTISAEALERLVRAYTPWPLVTVETHGVRMKIVRASLSPHPLPLSFVRRGGCLLPCQTGTLILDEVRPEGGNTMSGEAFMRGR